MWPVHYICAPDFFPLAVTLLSNSLVVDCPWYHWDALFIKEWHKTLDLCWCSHFYFWLYILRKQAFFMEVDAFIGILHPSVSFLDHLQDCLGIWWSSDYLSSSADTLKPQDVGLSRNLPLFKHASTSRSPPVTYLHLSALPKFSVS